MSFTGGPRYMYAHYLDALAICRKLGNPQFFITFTCNVKWPEIRRYMADYPELTAADRPDIVCRVFKQKIHAFLSFLKSEKIFGTVTALEFQKRGLPHCHPLLWVDSASKIQEPKDVDRVISAELPDPQIDPRSYKVVSEMMIHGPCELEMEKQVKADQQDPENTSWIDIPFAYCLPDNEHGLSNLIDFIYDQNTLKTPFAVTLQHKAIVCPKNETADMINSKVLEMVQGEMTSYLSHDEATPLECDRAET
ncbi:DNA helicase [Tanacetum coccineum]|uniref:DNA helicase n=1 Tax=Tanacetum coccineum TaxID=301880 RepID=A0ABQ5HXI5_9ASTR